MQFYVGYNVSTDLSCSLHKPTQTCPLESRHHLKCEAFHSHESRHPSPQLPKFLVQLRDIRRQSSTCQVFQAGCIQGCKANLCTMCSHEGCLQCVEEWWMGQDMPVWSLDLNERLMYLIFEIISDIKVVLNVLVRHFTLQLCSICSELVHKIRG